MLNFGTAWSIIHLFIIEIGNFVATLQTIRHRFNIYASSCVASVLWRGDGHRKLVTRFSVIRRV